MADPCPLDTKDKGPGEAGNVNEALTDAVAEVPKSPAMLQKFVAVMVPAREIVHSTFEVMKSAFMVPASVIVNMIGNPSARITARTYHWLDFERLVVQPLAHARGSAGAILTAVTVVRKPVTGFGFRKKRGMLASHRFARLLGS